MNDMMQVIIEKARMFASVCNRVIIAMPAIRKTNPAARLT
jgi:hypothetical protein